MGIDKAGHDPRRPTASIRSPRTRITPSSMIPPSAPRIVMMRPRTRATRPVGLAAATVRDRRIPLVGNWYVPLKMLLVSALNRVGPMLQCTRRPLPEKCMKSPPP
jgi:hypothetical protein